MKNDKISASFYGDMISAKVPQRLNIPSWSLWQLVTIFAVMAMSVSWVSLNFKLLVEGSAIIGILLLFGSTIMAAYLATRVMEFLRLDPPIPQVTLFAILVVAAFLSILLLIRSFNESGIRAETTLHFTDFSSLTTPLVITLAMVVYLWRRGMNLARHPVGPRAVQRDFRLGILVFLIVGGISTRLEFQLPIFEMVLFFVFSLLAMSGARLSAISHLRGGVGVPFERRWLFGIIAMAVGTTLVIGVIAVFAGNVLAGVVAVLFTGLVTLLAYAFMLIMWPLILLLLPPLTALLDKFALFIQALGLSEGAEIRPADVEGLIESLAEETVRPAWIDDLNTVLGGILILGVFLVILAFVLSGLRRMSARRKQPNALHPDDVSSIGSLGSALRDAFNIRAEQIAAGLSRLRPGSRMLASFRIRRIYAKLMSLSEDLGFPRHPSCTPREFLPMLEGHFPSLQMELTLITDSYVRVRYGEFPETHEEVEDVETAWSRIQAEGRQLKRSR